ncbi:MAG: hypothetical protein V3V84_08485 [Candidatus Bathyarchaeia archaeon]
MVTRSDVNVDYQPSPRVVEVAAPSTELTIQDTVDTIRISEEGFAAGLAFDKVIDAAGKEDLGGGVLVGITANLQNAQVAFEARTTPAETGTVTTGSGALANGFLTFVDSAADFVTAGIARGSLVINFTDNSIADVYDVIDSTTLKTRPLVNGSDNEFEVADNYQVFNIIQCNITGGNLVAEDDVSQISPVVPTAFTQIVRTASSSATLSESQDIQFASFNGAVTVDTSGSNSGTTFPTGTSRQPVNNFTDALAIAAERGLDKFFIIGDCTLDSGLDFDEFTFEGQSTARTRITVDASASVLASEFVHCTVTGTLDGESVIENGVADNLNVIDGVVRNSGLIGEITLSGVNDLQLLDCYEGSATRPYINFGGSGTGLIVTNYNGAIGLKNKSGAESGFLDMASGDILIDNDVTVGTITLRGVAKWDNKFTYSGGADIVDETIFTRVDETHGQIIRSVFLDGTAASNGNGYQQAPFDNWADAIVAVDDRGLSNIVLKGAVTMDRDISDLTIKGLNLPFVTLTGFKIDRCNFEECVIIGAQGTATNPADIQFFETCGILNVTNFNGSADGCALAGTIAIADSANCIMNDATELNPALGPIIIDFQAGGAAGSQVALENAAGEYLVRNMDHPDDRLIANFTAGEITIESSCTAGTVSLHGIGDWENGATYTGTTAVTDHLVSPQSTQYAAFNGAVWLDPLAGNSGTNYPVGTTEFPVDNDTDAETIATARGLLNIQVVHDTTVTGNHTDHKFIGRSPRTTVLTVDPGATLSGCEFENLLLTGTISGGTYITQCAIKNVSGLQGHFEQCVIREGTNTLSGASIGMFNKCVAVSATGPGVDIPIVDCNGAGSNVAFRGLIGELKITNKTGPEPMSIALNGARVELDATVTDGNIRVFGVGELIDNSGGTAVVDRDELVSPEYVMEDVWEATAASFDTVNSMGQVMNDVLAMASGKIVESPSGTFTFYDRDNTTPRFVLTKVGNERNRS